MADSDDDVLGKADALLGRHRAAPARRLEPPVDFPVLTDVYSRPLPPIGPVAAVAAAPAVSAAAAPGPMLTDAQLHEIERDLRLQLLQLMGPELERLVESRVHARMAPVISGIVERMRVDLENEIRRAVQDALTQVVEDEVARLQRTDGP
jgi:hypothetical protein